MSKIHPTAMIEDGAVLGADVEVAAYARIGRDVKLGDGVSVGQGAIIDGHTTIGERAPISTYETEPSRYLRSCVFMPIRAYGNIWHCEPMVVWPSIIAPCPTVVPSPILTSAPTRA
jgi:NDP-sugar pyrophosphorylase family protein